MHTPKIPYYLFPIKGCSRPLKSPLKNPWRNRGGGAWRCARACRCRCWDVWTSYKRRCARGGWHQRTRSPSGLAPSAPPVSSCLCVWWPYWCLSLRAKKIVNFLLFVPEVLDVPIPQTKKAHDYSRAFPLSFVVLYWNCPDFRYQRKAKTLSIPICSDDLLYRCMEWLEKQSVNYKRQR